MLLSVTGCLVLVTQCAGFLTSDCCSSFASTLTSVSIVITDFTRCASLNTPACCEIPLLRCP